MTVAAYPNKILFGGKDADGKAVNVDGTIDFAEKMANAIDVQMIDTNLYMSKELWLPYNARGAFGGQVHNRILQQINK
jgi:hypothetical protein